jgi:hypothetical protein
MGAATTRAQIRLALPGASIDRSGVVHYAVTFRASCDAIAADREVAQAILQAFGADQVRGLRIVDHPSTDRSRRHRKATFHLRSLLPAGAKGNTTDAAHASTAPPPLAAIATTYVETTDARKPVAGSLASHSPSTRASSALPPNEAAAPEFPAAAAFLSSGDLR